MDSPIIITGATSNLGTVLLERLRLRWPDREMVALTRSASNPVFERFRVLPVIADLVDPRSYKSALSKDCVVVAVAHRSYTDMMLPILNEVEAQACFAVTSTSVFVKNHPEADKYQAIEERMRASDVPVTILRPSMLYGRGRDQNISQLIRVLSKTPIYPIFGSGEHLMQPVYVDDVANAILSAITHHVRGEFNLAGPEPITYKELVETVAEELNRKVRYVHVPQRLAESLVAALNHFPGFPLDVDQVRRLTEDKNYDISQAVRELSYAPRSFRQGVRDEIRQLSSS